MKITILIDNKQSADGGLLFFEHGLSIYMEACGKRILVDTGLSGKAMLNAEAMGIDVGKVDYLILSHGHKDHTGGLEDFMRRNHSAWIVGHKKINEYNYTSDSHGHRHSLNPDRNPIESNPERFVWLNDGDTWEIHHGYNMVSAGCCDIAGYHRPMGNRLLHVNGNPYNGDDELIVSIVENGRLTVISPCSHSGIGNIIECAEMRTGVRTSTFIGGLHYIDSETHSEEYSFPEIGKIYTGHCTGEIAKERLSAMLGDRVEFFRTGDVIYC